MQREISTAILTMQKDRYFECLTSKYWNSTGRLNCPVLDDSKGITINSLGGIFIATLVGLVISMITLAYELWQQKKLDEKQVAPTDLQKKVIKVGKRQVQVGLGSSKFSSTIGFGKTSDGDSSSGGLPMPTISGMSY